ncbi:MAG: response regulator [Legionellales bacterium]|nr:response regulator [Legionellales bacterium]
MNIPKDNKQAKKEFTRLIKETESAKKIAHITKVFLKNITESLPQYVFWKDLKSVYLGCNKNFAQLVGLSTPEEIVGKTDADINWQPTGHTAETFQQGDQDTISGHPITNQEEVLVLPNGKTLITLVSKLPIVDEGKVIGIVGYFTDITEIKQKEKELIKARQQAEAANQAKSVFITNISHDIRTPLTGMIGMARIIFKELKNTQGQEAANNLLKAGNILLDLLNEVIEITKLDSGDLPVYEVKFSAKELIDNLAMLVTPSANEKNLQCTVDYDESIPNYLIGDQTRIHRILLNLMSNAIKFTEEGTVGISVKLAKEQERDVVLKIEVNDTGIGIPEDKQQIIFSRFHRLDPSYKGSYKGSGLGLSIVKQFIAEIDGEIYVDSEAGKGSTFTCVIPLKKTLLDEPENKTEIHFNEATVHELRPYNLNIMSDVGGQLALSPEKLPANTSEKAAKVLLVEDNKMAQFAAKNQLEEFGCDIDVADTGEEALTLLKKNQYDLVFMDIGLPDKSGCDVTAEIREWEKQHQRHTPIVALTAHIDESNKQQCLNVGMEKVLTKPLTDENAQTILKTFVYQAPDSSMVLGAEEKDVEESIPSIDLKLGAQLTGGNEAIAKDMLKMFVDSLPETEDNLKKSYETEDWDQLQFDVHKLHGGACYCGVPRLKDIARKLEDSLKSRDFEEIAQGYEDLIAEIQNVQLEYRKV